MKFNPKTRFIFFWLCGCAFARHWFDKPESFWLFVSAPFVAFAASLIWQIVQDSEPVDVGGECKANIHRFDCGEFEDAKK